MQTQLVLVEAVQSYRMRYVVEVPVGIDDYGNDKATWALDTVTMNEAAEFSQLALPEIIISHRVISAEEALVLCNQDNDYCESWSDELKIKTFITPFPDPVLKEEVVTA